jgi:hypothetical protein
MDGINSSNSSGVINGGAPSTEDKQRTSQAQQYISSLQLSMENYGVYCCTHNAHFKPVKSRLK